ncbi:aminoglycoside phosphotransferase family protein [Legionella santicrucis]|nr:aminoglycoside phosphotransferase family protein [Legionella santicrucis]
MNRFLPYLAKWRLIEDGDPILTTSSHLLPVIFDNQPCMLKIPLIEEEKIGCQVMRWWNGHGAAKVLLSDDTAILMARATGTLSLFNMVKHNQDDEASVIICSVVKKLHAVTHRPLPDNIVPLSLWFRSLKLAAKQHGGIFHQALITSQKLLEEQSETRVLHGDIHHQNILDFGDSGWLAIDPKGLLGNRYYDYANILCNPDYTCALVPGRLERQAKIIATEADLDYHLFLHWILAYAGLSAAWHLEDGSSPDLAIEVAKLSASLI